jgi:hypothetical protein
MGWFFEVMETATWKENPTSPLATQSSASIVQWRERDRSRGEGRRWDIEWGIFMREEGERERMDMEESSCSPRRTVICCFLLGFEQKIFRVIGLGF